MFRSVAWITVALLLGSTFLLMVGCGQEQAQPAEPAQTQQTDPEEPAVDVDPAAELDPAALAVLNVAEGRLVLADVTADSSLLIEGWTPIGRAGGAWTLESPARLAFRVAGAPASQPLQFDLRFIAQMVDGHQQYRIKNGNQVVAQDSLTVDQGVFRKSFAAYFNLTPNPDGVVVLDIEVDRMVSPAALGVNSDTRTLGVFLMSVGVKADAL